MSSSSTRDRVAALIAAGLPRSEIAERLGVSRSTVSYHARQLGMPIDARCARRYDWAIVQAFHDDGHGMLECLEHFGFARQAWSDAIARGVLVARPHALPIEELLPGARNRAHLRRRLVRAGLLEERCADCGLIEWRGRPIVLQLHHVNGIGDDNRLENLRLLCPNCHSQTENGAGATAAGATRRPRRERWIRRRGAARRPCRAAAPWRRRRSRAGPRPAGAGPARRRG